MKQWYKSRTIWLNLASLAMVLAAMPEMLALLPAEWLPYIAMLTAIGNKYLRFDTSMAIGTPSSGGGFDDGGG